DDQPGNTDARRGLAGSVAARGGSRLRVAANPHELGCDDRAGRAGPTPRHESGRPDHLHARRADRARSQAGRSRPRRYNRRLFRHPRPSWIGGGEPMIWVNQILQGVLLGGYYAVIACGLSFMFSVMRIINLAHGSLAIVAAFGLFVLADQFGVA